MNNGQLMGRVQSIYVDCPRNKNDIIKTHRLSSVIISPVANAESNNMVTQKAHF